MNEIFYEFKEIKNQEVLYSKGYGEIVLHFLAKVSETLILYETKQILTKSQNLVKDKQLIDSLKKIFNGVDPSLILIKGKIREIFLSYSS